MQNITAEEVDQLICNPDSAEEDPLSKDSFNTDKIRQEQLQVNVPCYIQVEAIASQQYSPARESGIGSMTVMTFGHNSQVEGRTGPDAMAQLQEIYSLH